MEAESGSIMEAGMVMVFNLQDPVMGLWHSKGGWGMAVYDKHHLDLVTELSLHDTKGHTLVMEFNLHDNKVYVRGPGYIVHRSPHLGPPNHCIQTPPHQGLPGHGVRSLTPQGLSLGYGVQRPMF